MRRITADYIFPISSPPIENGVVVIDDKGLIIEVGDSALSTQHSVSETHKGVICPGFINTHCHLELSHLKRKIPPATGLNSFIQGIEAHRKTELQVILAAIEKAEDEMLASGVVAVGDISNRTDSFLQKKKKRLHYHTFIEAFAFHPNRADKVFDNALQLFQEYSSSVDKKHISIVPHAPYSASEKLLKKIADFATTNNSILTIHNQESAGENEFFIHKTGEIVERFRHFGIDISFWNPPGVNSLPSTLVHLPKNNKILLVHNTYTSRKDIKWANEYFGGSRKNISNLIYWCFCPNANLYIENKLPDFDLFIAEEAKITIGTDSYASNWSLSVLDELKTITSRSPHIPLQTLLSWACKNGAEFLGFDATLGSIEKGKKPGLNLIKNVDLKNLKLTTESAVEVLG